MNVLHDCEILGQWLGIQLNNVVYVVIFYCNRCAYATTCKEGGSSMF